jgi:CheY-like chemotaxis protein
VLPDGIDPFTLDRRTAPESRRVLLVDDNVDYAESLAILLESAGYAVQVRHNGLEALRCALEFRPDVAVLDIGMPVMDGYQIARLLRQQPVLAALRLVAVSGYQPRPESSLSLEARFDDYLMKPLQLPELVASFGW